MIFIEEDQKREFEHIRCFAKRKGIERAWDQMLEYLDDYGDEKTRCRFGFHAAPHSFYLVMERQDQHGIWRRVWDGTLYFNGVEWSVHR